MSELDGRVVTGGSRGIGAAIARRLAGAGATVALTYVASADKAQAVAKRITEPAGSKARKVLDRYITAFGTAEAADPAAVAVSRQSVRLAMIASVLTVTAEHIARIVVFGDTGLFNVFGMPALSP